MAHDALERVFRYHDGTKHHFNRFAQSLGYLDWASQPRPFRAFDGAPLIELPRTSPSSALPGAQLSYDRLYSAVPDAGVPLSIDTLGYFLRHALGLSAWKAYRDSRWALRVNPSSGNLHPTEAYVVTGAVEGLAQDSGVWHYAPDRHALERRCAFPGEAWEDAGVGAASDAFLVVLTSIHWRESWKYGERAFRYCQHDLGHAVAALRLSAALCGWRMRILPAWSHRDVAALAGIDRDEDFVDAEREEPACVLVVSRRHEGLLRAEPRADWLDGVRRGTWSGRASQLSQDHVAWTFIDEVAAATTDPGHVDSPWQLPHARAVSAASTASSHAPPTGATVILQRRSAVALDGASFIGRERFLGMLARTLPGPDAPWDAQWWSPRIHLAIFVHRVTGLEPGLYMLVRDEAARERLAAACEGQMPWTVAAEGMPLFLLRSGDCRAVAKRLSCGQDIAADGAFSLGMIADFEASLNEHGPSFYRHLFWESGMIGQVLYLEAEAAGVRGTGIGCFFDDPVHDLLGLQGRAFQSLYHFTIGAPVDDSRLTTEPGYAWDVASYSL